MGIEEQKEEREVLDSIFPDEITDLSDNSFRVAITLEVDGEGEEDEPPILWLTITYPETYPDVAPHLDLAQPPNSTKHPHLDIQSDKETLLSSLDSTIEESLGMAMVFTLVSTLKDASELLIAERQKAVEAQAEIVAQEQEKKENEKFQGAQVTAKSFGEWRDEFMEEMRKEREKAREEREAEEKKKRSVGGAGKAEERLTGKMLWERGLAGKAGEEEDEEDGVDALKAVEKMSIKA